MPAIYNTKMYESKIKLVSLSQSKHMLLCTILVLSIIFYYIKIYLDFLISFITYLTLKIYLIYTEHLLQNLYIKYNHINIGYIN